MRKIWTKIIPLFALTATILLFQFVLFVGYVPTESMEPADLVALLHILVESGSLSAQKGRGTNSGNQVRYKRNPWVFQERASGISAYYRQGAERKVAVNA